MTDDDASLQARIDTLLRPDSDPGVVSETSVPIPFSPFVRAHARRAGEVASRLFEAADRDGLEAGVAAAEDAAGTESSRGLVMRAVKTFVTHHPEARSHLRLPAVQTLEVRELDDDAPPPPVVPDEPLPPGEEDRAAVPSLTFPESERRLDWYREDPFANFHHAHWHVVWDTKGVTLHGGDLITEHRQGELFIYMHEQMLARYDTERKIAGLEPTIAFAPPYTAPITEGYGAAGYATRPAGVALRAVQLEENRPPVGPHDLNARYTKIDAAIAAGHLTVPSENLGPLDGNQLGAAIEPSDLWIDEDSDLDLALDSNGGYENIHGLGHVLTAVAADRSAGDTWWGPMRYTETAIRDPFFYRWHRHIDDQSARLQDKLGAADLAEHAANVSFRDGGATDIKLCFSDQVGGDDFDAFGLQRLGPGLSEGGELTTDTLTTRFGLSRVTAPLPQKPGGSADEESYWTTHLRHRPFALFLRVETQQPQHVTVRVFLVHEDLADDRRMWIELDKFDRELQAGVNVIGRPDALSSVIRRTGVDAPGAIPAGNGNDDLCNCGWPYTLLLPSGASTGEGTGFKLAVALTNWNTDHSGEPRSCGSMSYCGARERYPDEREMGYPFHRPFPGGVLATLAGLPNVAMRTVTIRCENARLPE